MLEGERIGLDTGSAIPEEKGKMVRQGDWCYVPGARTVGWGEAEAAEEKCPSHLPGVQPSHATQVSQVLVIVPSHERQHGSPPANDTTPAGPGPPPATHNYQRCSLPLRMLGAV